MSYTTDIYTKSDKGLEHIATITGSDVPSYFDDIKKTRDFYAAIKSLFEDEDRQSWAGTWPNVWKNSKTSDHVLIVEEQPKRWYHFGTNVKIYQGIKVSLQDQRYDNNTLSFIPHDDINLVKEIQEVDEVEALRYVQDYGFVLTLPNMK